MSTCTTEEGLEVRGTPTKKGRGPAAGAPLSEQVQFYCTVIATGRAFSTVVRGR
jgi:hypothetical protein